MSGKVFGLGIGPGDPELITLKALRLLRAVPVIAYPAPEQGDSLARRIVADYLPGQQTEIELRMPMVSERFPAQEVYDRALTEFAQHLERGRDIAVLCEGDPFFYGSFMYLFGRLVDNRYPVEVVPGVSSLTACAAMLGAPLAARNDTLSVLPAPLDNVMLAEKLRQSDAAAIIKVGRHLPRIHALLTELRLLDRAYYIERATLNEQRIARLSDLSAEQAPYFSMILIHQRGVAWTV